MKYHEEECFSQGGKTQYLTMQPTLYNIFQTMDNIVIYHLVNVEVGLQRVLKCVVANSVYDGTIRGFVGFYNNGKRKVCDLSKINCLVLSK